MKTLILCFFIISPAVASECRITGVLLSNNRLETSFKTESFSECKEMALKRDGDKFFGLISSEDRLMETKVQYIDAHSKVTEVLENASGEDVL